MRGKEKSLKKATDKSQISVGVSKIPMQKEFKEALESNTHLDKEVVKIGESNKLACDDLIISINKERLHLD